MNKLVIFGTGDIARLAHFYFRREGKHEVVAFTVDRDWCTSPTFEGKPLVAFDDVTARFPPGEHQMFVALSYAKMNQVRAAKYVEAKDKGYKLASYVSPQCTFLTEEPIGDNCFILEDNTVQPFVRIGSNVTLWSGNHIGHDATIDDHCFLASHIVVSGRVHVKPFCFIGVNATIRNGVVIAPRTLVGAGAAVMQDTQEGAVHLPPEQRVSRRTSDQIEL